MDKLLAFDSKNPQDSLNHFNGVVIEMSENEEEDKQQQNDEDYDVNDYNENEEEEKDSLICPEEPPQKRQKV